MTGNSFKASLLAGAALWLTAGAAAAQASAAPPPAGAPSGDIVVTARRTPENVQSVPLAISAFTDRTLDKLGATDATALQGLVPNLNIVQGRGSPDAANVYLRGLGQPDALQTFDPAVGQYLDDVYLSRIRGVLFNLFDLDHVEVLRGPQGTLYGKNTIGGAIRYVTRKPGQTWFSYASVGAGDHGQYEAKATLMGPVNPYLALGGSVYLAGHDDYVKDVSNSQGYNNQKNAAFRLQAAITPSDRFRIDLSYDYTHEAPHMTVGQPTASVYRINLLPPTGLAPITVLYPGQTQWDYTAKISPTLPNRAPLNHGGASGTATWKINDDWTLKSITAYRRLNYDDSIDIDATPYQLGDVTVGVTQRQTSQEFQLNYESGKWKAVAGAFWMREHISSTQFAFGNDLYTLFGLPYPAIRKISDDLVTNSYAGYVNATYSLTDALRITGGLRYTDETKTYFRTTNVNGGAPFAFTVKHSWDNVSPTVSIDYRYQPNVLFYGRISEGFLSGGFNGRANNPGEQQPYNPETVVTYEAGAKTSWLDRTLIANLTVFYNDFRDFQARVSQSVPDPTNPANPPIIALTVLNAGKLTTAGAELELQYHPIKALSLDSQIGYLDASYDRFNDRNFISATNPTGDRSFQKPAFSPKVTARFGGAYEWTLGQHGLPGRGYLTLGGGASYRSKMALTVDNTSTAGAPYSALFQGAYWLYDARLVWESEDRKYSLGVYGKNLSGEKYKTDAQEFSSVAGIQTVYYGDPRTVFVRLTGRFF